MGESRKADAQIEREARARAQTGGGTAGPEASTGRATATAAVPAGSTVAPGSGTIANLHRALKGTDTIRALMHANGSA